MSREEIREPKKYYSIVSGTFRTQVPQEDPSAVRRDWTSADGKKSGTKYERIVNALFGRIEDIQFIEGEFGLQMLVKLDANEDRENPILALATSSREGEDVMKKLPNVDLSKEIRFRPFNFEGEGGDEVRGMELMQQGESDEFNVKITNFFTSTEKKEDGSMKRNYLNGFPEPDGNTEDYSKDDWKIYFLTARKFLINYTKEKIAPKLGQATTTDAVEALGSAVAQKENNNPDEIPF